MDSQDVVAMWAQMRQFISEGYVLICDHARIHTSETALRYLFAHPEIMVEPPPKYAPEVNPEEHCHGNVKARVANMAPADQMDLRRFLDRGFARRRRRPDLVLNFVHAAGPTVRPLW
jgi:hypothetical protein